MQNSARMTPTRQLKVFMSHPDWNEQGGPTSHLPLLIAELENRPDVRLHSFVYGFRKIGKIPRRVCRSLPFRVAIMLADILKFLLMCLRFGRPDVLHLNSSYETFALGRDIPYSLICRALRIGCVIKTHGSDEALLGPLPIFWDRVQRLYLNGAQVITFLSPVEAQQFRDRFPAHTSKFHVAKNIVVPTDEKVKPSVPGQILFGGRFVEKKNIPNLLEGFALVAAEHGHSHLVMAGTGPLEDFLHGHAKALGLEGRITWTGWVGRNRLRQLNAESPITVFTSTGSEGMPMILVESLNSNSVVVTTSVRWTQSYPIKELGVIELAGSGPKDIAEGLCRALNMPPIDTNLKAQRRAFLSKFSKEVVADEFFALYQSVARANATCQI